MVMNILETNYTQMEGAYSEVCALYGENHLTMDSTEFFRLFFSFADSYQVV